jgi:hypothetical protein
VRSHLESATHAVAKLLLRGKYGLLAPEQVLREQALSEAALDRGHL